MKQNYYDIKYIFDFKDKNQELENIKKLGVEEYIKNYAVFSDINDKDYISPIYSSSKIIGYCYKYNPSIDYNICFNYNDYLDNVKFYIISELYFNYYKLLKQMKETSNYYYEEKYYLINKDYLSEIKKDFHYEEIKKIFDKNKFYERDYLDEKKNYHS